MRQEGKFILFADAGEFRAYLGRTKFVRAISVIQNHHTFVPGYKDFNGRNHFDLLLRMERAHVHDRGWKEIGQNINTFPDGTIAVCRAIDKAPAGIFGANTGALCLEHLGFFDKGKDVMEKKHADSIVGCNAALCERFALPVDSNHVVYHHWYDTTGKRFPVNVVNSGTVNEKHLQKTCPGTAFFGGNLITDAEREFFQRIREQLKNFTTPGVVTLKPVASKLVVATALNVREKADSTATRIRVLTKGTRVDIYELNGGWAKIHPLRQEWVSDSHLQQFS